MKTSGSSQDYDLVILGSGEAGKFLAWTFAKKGMKTVVIERKYIGGSCPNIACLPSKNIIHSAKVASYFWRSEEFGISKDNCRINMAGVRERKRKMVAGLVDLHLANYKASGAELLLGTGKFIAPKTIEVALPDGGTRVIRGKRVIIGTGTRATIEPIPGLRESAPMTHIEALELDQTPGQLLILGGGYVGLEMGQALRRFGAGVTIIERNSRLVHREDEDVTDMLHGILKDEGIEIITNTHVNRVEGRSGQYVKLHVTRDGAQTAIEGTHLLVAGGRTPNTENIGLELARVKTTERGYIQVNERLETTAPGVWAVGDCAGSPNFTHISFDDFRVISENLTRGRRVTTGRQVPFCMFTDPEFARIGLSETEAKERGIDYRLAKMPMAADLRTRTLSETRGFMKALIETKSDRILGLTVLGVGAGEIIAPVQVAMLAGMPYTALRDTIFTHPTLAEGLVTLFSNVPSAPARVAKARATIKKTRAIRVAAGNGKTRSRIQRVLRR
jgi:pyruvate/2-oxoglutarate dehydrogenase complex dihydrolipoamide dehydrogenase (E3) component